uniref:Uncharacterized protein n=1 Tax=Caenorhabditis japonica TaxID=281687 RepID=A0A8R1I221_CAEJA
MSLHLQLQKTSTPSTSTETAKNPTPAPSFSIDTILNFPASNISEHVASKQHTLLEKLSESEEDVVTSSSPSPTCSSTSFTLDSLQSTDRRRLNKKTWVLFCFVLLSIREESKCAPRNLVLRGFHFRRQIISFHVEFPRELKKFGDNNENSIALSSA